MRERSAALVAPGLGPLGRMRADVHSLPSEARKLRGQLNGYGQLDPVRPGTAVEGSGEGGSEHKSGGEGEAVERRRDAGKQEREGGWLVIVRGMRARAASCRCQGLRLRGCIAEAVTRNERRKQCQRPLSPLDSPEHHYARGGSIRGNSRLANIALRQGLLSESTMVQGSKLRGVGGVGLGAAHRTP